MNKKRLKSQISWGIFMHKIAAYYTSIIDFAVSIIRLLRVYYMSITISNYLDLSCIYDLGQNKRTPKVCALGVRISH